MTSKKNKRNGEQRELEKYHEVFVPFPDVYHTGGLEVFVNLARKESALTQGERNLIVLPIGFSEKLGELESKEQSEGAASALKYINSARDEKYKILDDVNGGRVTIYRTSSGLDVAYVDDPRLVKEDFRMELLLDTIKQFTHAINPEGNPLKLITSIQSNHLKYDSRGFVVEEPEFLQVNEDIVTQGIISGNEKLQARLNSVASQGPVSLEEAIELQGRELFMNQFIRFPGHQYARVTAELVLNKSGDRIIKLKDARVEMLSQQEHNMNIRIGNVSVNNVLGVSPRDMEQKIALQYGIFNPAVSLLFMAGKRGTGKTILNFSSIDQALIYGQEDRKKRQWPDAEKAGIYKKVIILKAPEVLGGARREVGFLPGNLFEKIRPHIQPYIDAHEETILSDVPIPFEDLIRHPKYDNGYGIRTEQGTKPINGAHMPPNSALIEVRYSGFMGGASLGKTLMLIDEAQDYTPYEIKTLLERVGEGSKVIISGDPAQTRNPYCSKKINGFTYAIKYYLKKPYSMLVELMKNYRHQISEDSDEMPAQNPV